MDAAGWAVIEGAGRGMWRCNMFLGKHASPVLVNLYRHVDFA
jgi:hypothetical protein